MPKKAVIETIAENGSRNSAAIGDFEEYYHDGKERLEACFEGIGPLPKELEGKTLIYHVNAGGKVELYVLNKKEKSYRRFGSVEDITKHMNSLVEKYFELSEIIEEKGAKKVKVAVGEDAIKDMLRNYTEI